MARLSKEAQKYIENNLDVSNRKLSKKILKKFNLKTSHVAVGNYKNSLESKNLPKKVSKVSKTTIKTQRKKKKLTFESFCKFVLDESEPTGSNSLSIGEIKIRRTDLKNHYLLIEKLKDSGLI